MELLGLNWKAIALQSVTFIILAIAMRKFLFAPVLGMLDQRRNEVQATFDRMAADRSAMEAARADYEQRLVNIEAEARERIQAAVKEAQALREQIINDSRSQGDALVLRAQEEITREKQKALVELRTQVAEMAVGAAGKILGKAIDPQAHRELIGGFIDDVGRA